jgi:hypothetical protein
MSTIINHSKSISVQEKVPFTFPNEVHYNLIIGCPRSGTTFLKECLECIPYSTCASSHLLLPSIPHIVNHSISSEIYESLSRSFEFALQDYLESIAKHRSPEIIKWLKGYTSIQELIRSLLYQRKIEHFVYHEPFLSFAPEYAYKALPNCRIIYIYRDGRDVANSLERSYQVLTDEKLMTLLTLEMPLGRKYDYRYVPWWVQQGLENDFLSCSPYVRAIWMWKEMTRRCNDFFSRQEIIDSGRVMFLKYENLVNEPLKYGESVVKHFNCNMSSRLEKQFKKAKKSSVGNYKKRSNSQEIESAEIIAKEELKLYQYL